MKIGVDAGGTKTELILIDDEGVIVARHSAPGCNPSLVGPDKARGILLQALEELLSPAKALRDASGALHPARTFTISETHIYAAGSSQFWRETADALVHFGKVVTASDSIPVLELATNGEPGLVLHAGTGSFVAARGTDDSVHYAGGLGWRFGDPGSAVDISRRAIARGLLELQDWMPRSGLGDAVCAYAGRSRYAEVSRFFYDGADANGKVAPFAAVVVELAMKGNRAAQLSIVESLTEQAVRRQAGAVRRQRPASQHRAGPARAQLLRFQPPVGGRPRFHHGPSHRGSAPPAPEVTSRLRALAPGRPRRSRCAVHVGNQFTVLSESAWLERRRAHEARVRAWTDPHQERQSRGEKHPVEDFLFEYYSYRPSWLRRWHPGPDVALAGAAAREYLRWPEYREAGEGVMVDPSTFDPKRRDSLHWLRDLLRATSQRAPQFGCFGLHEWAMVYREEKVRHPAWPLRFSREKLAEIVDATPIRCTHFDAFRFFTPAARPLNRHQPERATTLQHEQRGCLHANMDLYKWAFKLAPFTPSELVADCFELAREIRQVDMRASPYDLRALGYEPVAVETAAGKVEYEAHQREFARRSEPLRARLLALVERLCHGGP
jgi:N-acetylglucosamine kinase-like BadF-type ATPase